MTTIKFIEAVTLTVGPIVMVSILANLPKSVKELDYFWQKLLAITLGFLLLYTPILCMALGIRMFFL